MNQFSVQFADNGNGQKQGYYFFFLDKRYLFDFILLSDVACYTTRLLIK